MGKLLPKSGVEKAHFEPSFKFCPIPLVLFKVFWWNSQVWTYIQMFTLSKDYFWALLLRMKWWKTEFKTMIQNQVALLNSVEHLTRVWLSCETVKRFHNSSFRDKGSRELERLVEHAKWLSIGNTAGNQVHITLVCTRAYFPPFSVTRCSYTELLSLKY